MTKKRSLAEMKAAYASTGNSNNNTPRRDNNYYPFWDMQFNEKAVIRFLPDLNEDNPRGFMVEKVFHNLTINDRREQVPCPSSVGEPCPICELSQNYYSSDDEINGKKYYKKRQYIAQAIVIDDPLPPDQVTGEKHTGKLKYISINWQLYTIIKEAFEGDDLEFPPDDVENGYDFIIKKTEQGKYASYTVGTKFATRSRALSDEEFAVYENRVDLSTLLPKQLGAEKVRAMLNADINGGSVEDDGGFSSPARPANRVNPARSSKSEDSADDDDDDNNDAPAAPASRPSRPRPTDDEGVETNADKASESSVNSVIEQIRARRKAQAAG